MDNTFNEDVLITEVQSKPLIWDPSDDLYMKKKASRDAWNDVCDKVIPGFYNLPIRKQRDYLDQLRNRWQCIRTAYRAALVKREPFQRGGPKLSFLNKIFPDIADQTPLNGENLSNANDRNGEEHPYKYEKEEFVNANNSPGLSETVFLDPVLSITKIDDKINERTRAKVGRSAKRKSSKPQEVVVPSTTKSKIRQETSARPIVDCNDEDSDQGSSPKSRRFQYEVQLASTRRNAAPEQTSAHATVSFDDDKPAGYGRVAYSHQYEAYNDRPVPERGSSPSPQTSRRREPYYSSSCHMIPTLPVDHNDEDMAFFRSLLTWTRRFTEQEKLEFRMEVMKLVTRMCTYESVENYYVISQTPLS